MKKATKTKRQPELLSEYDFSRGRPNKYAKRYAEGTNMVLLAPDVARFFPDSAAVNDALRALVKIAEKRAKKPRS
jgi:hypothetical protein